jgi:hypothetical protein
MALSEFVSVSIQAGTVTPARRGFGVPLIMAFHTAWAGSEVRSYRTFAEVSADFPASGSAGLMPRYLASTLFSQNPRPELIKIGRLPTPTGVMHTVVVDFTDHATGEDITGSHVSPTGTETAIDIAWNTNIATTLADLKTALDALTGIGTCTVASPLITIPATTAGEMNHFSFDGLEDIRETTADWGIDDALDAALVIDPAFYGVLCDSNSPKNIDKVARWALANGRLAGFAPQYSDPADFASGEFTSGSDLTALLTNDRAWGLFKAEARDGAADGGWFGRLFPYDPGSATWAFKRLAGCSPDTWTTSQITTIESTNHGNTYRTESALPITYPGKTFGGEWIDVVIGLDWLTARIEERIFALYASTPKIPYTDAGLGLIQAEIEGALEEAERRSVVDAGWTVTKLAVADQEEADRDDRIARGFEFQARLAGAIHKASVTGTVSA